MNGNDENSKLDYLCREVETIKRALLGKLDDPKDRPGLLVRVDRVEQRLNRRDTLLYATLTAALTALVGVILNATFSYFTSG